MMSTKAVERKSMEGDSVSLAGDSDGIFRLRRVSRGGQLLSEGDRQTKVVLNAALVRVRQKEAHVTEEDAL